VAPSELVELVGLGHVPSAFHQSVPPVVRDTVAFDFDRPGARSHGIGYDRCEPGEHEPGQHFAPEAVGKHERFGGAMRIKGEQS
jgi:hypothetical protein